MKRSSLVRALFAFFILVASGYVVMTAKPQLGLDLRGGTQIVLETSDSPTVKAGKETTDKALGHEFGGWDRNSGPRTR